MLESPGNWRHVCVDMQRIFAEDTPWCVEWARQVLPAVIALAERAPERTIFTRFMTQRRAEEMHGRWRDYYEKWPMMTRAVLDSALLDLVTPLKTMVPPAQILDKMVYSPWMDGRLHAHLQAREVDTVVISGGETDVCVLATALGAIDLGYRVILIKDALCSAFDPTHDASLSVIGSRFSVQADVMELQAFLDSIAGSDR